jgi:hypothetical protein
MPLYKPGPDLRERRGTILLHVHLFQPPDGRQKPAHDAQIHFVIHPPHPVVPCHVKPQAAQLWH